MISVVIPVYNVEKYISACLKSVIVQTYEDIEIIIVNDGSTDNSLNICEEFAKADKRIKIITQENGGISAARNTGIKYACGEYITFIDSDDVIDSDMLQYLYEMIQDNDMAVCQRKNIDAAGNILRTKNKVQSRVINGNKNCMKEFFTTRDIDTVAWGKLYNRKHFENIKYPNGKYHEDIFTTYLIVAQCKKIAIGSEAKYLYRNRDSGISKIKFTRRHLDSVKGNLERKEYVIKHYPELVKYAEAGIIYASNICSYKIAKSGVEDNDSVKYLQSMYRDYEKSFLTGKSGIVSKLYSIAAWVNLELLINVISAFRRKNLKC